MSVDELQNELACLGPGQALSLSAAQFDEVFRSFDAGDEREQAARNLAHLYRCSVAFTGQPEAFAILSKDSPATS